MGECDWTANDGSANSSPIFLALSLEIERVIRSSAHDLIAGDADTVARVILANMAHKHGMVPGRVREPDGVFVLCQHPGCSQRGVVPAGGRAIFDEPETGRPKPEMYCESHALDMQNQGASEYTVVCPNCGCKFSV